MIGKSLFRTTPRVVLAVAAIVFAAVSPCFAFDTIGSSFGSLVPLKAIESVFGPIFPCNGPVGSTLRSEFGIGIGAAQLTDAYLTGSRGTELKLADAMNLDEGPLRIDIFAHLRYWRLGLRADYRNFEFKNNHRNFGKIEFNGPILSGNFDAVQSGWVTFGVCADYYFIEPRLKGNLLAVSPGTSGRSLGTFAMEVKGDRPITAGVYLRHLPPDLLGAPAHIEAWYKFPIISQTKLTSFGLALVYRPQIYRFDIACRVLVERTNLKFASFLIDPNTAARFPFIDINNPGIPDQHWEVRMQWDLIGVEFLAYF
jgi:hypothetical protein